MDPVTALALACNVTQLVGQAIEATRVCKELYERGSLDDNNRIEEYTEGIFIVTKDLDARLQDSKASSPRATRLQKIANEASATAAELKIVLNQLKLSKKQGNRKISSAFKATLKAFSKKGTIEKLRQQLEQQDAALHSGLLTELYIKAGQDDLMHRKEYQALSHVQKDTITEVLSRLQLMSNDVLTSVKISESALRAHFDHKVACLEQGISKKSIGITDTVRGLETRLVDIFDDQDANLREITYRQCTQTSFMQNQAQKDLQIRLLDALSFPEMNERLNMIEGRVSDFGETYRWIFRPPVDNECCTNSRQQQDFVRWLRDEENIFWISGKPGSGKSTLMLFIFQNLQPGRPELIHLNAWAAPHSARILSFWFFRPAASRLLKSLEGFWRTICFQILDIDNSLIEKARRNDDGLAPESLKARLSRSGSLAQTWINAELKLWFTYLVTHSKYNYCILIDGLDEAETNREVLLDTLRYLAFSSKNVKICCSSRPDAPFRYTLQNHSSLRLQDFNYKDIEIYCSRRLANTRAEQYISEITSRAEGVFLWAYLVAEDLRAAASHGDDERELKQRLQECPDEMNDLFGLLLQQQDKFYTKHPKPYLCLLNIATMAREAPSLLALLIASQEQARLASDLNNLNAEFLASLDSAAMELEENLVARCAGLVEVVATTSSRQLRFPKAFPFEAIVKSHGREARFIHRSARDFLLDGERGGAFLRSCSISDQDALKRLMMASAVTFRINDWDERISRPLEFGRFRSVEFCTLFGISGVDTLLSTYQSRFPLKLPPLSDQIAYGWHCCLPGSLSVLSAHLSPAENLTFGLAAIYEMTAYFEAKLPTLDPALSKTVAGFSLCAHLRSRSWRNPIGNDLFDTLKPYLSATQTVTLYYKWESNLDACFFATCPLWQHIHMAVTQEYLAPRSEKWQRNLQSLVHELPSGSSGEGLYTDGWLLQSTSSKPSPAIIPIPDHAAAIIKEKVRRGVHIFRVRAFVYKPTQCPSSILDFCQYSPRGLSRFLHIEPGINRILQHVFLQKQELDDFYGSSAKLLAAILNRHLECIPPEVIASVTCYNASTATLIFSEGQIRTTTVEAYMEWRNRLKYGIYHLDFETGPEKDTILCAILTEFHHLEDFETE